MPSEKKNKRNKVENKASTSNESLKPLSSYVSDRLELTKQLFSCLKNKQIKSRLPPSLQNKSIERIQQICLDEILGVSTKRLISIINNTTCPENTDSDDSEIEPVDEHVSLEEISSDSEAEAGQKAKEAPKKSEGAKKPKEDSKKTPKEMTMLELLELQARARAIRSQLALEPVTKIELDETDEEGDVEKKEVPKEATKSNNKSAEKPKTVAPTEPPTRRIVVPPPPPAKAAAPVAKPVKLKRNYKSKASDGAALVNVDIVKKETTPQKTMAPEFDDDKHEDDDDVITMDPSPETFFISDSDDEPPPKKSPQPTPVKEVSKSPERKPEEPKEQEEGEISDNEKSSREATPEATQPLPEDDLPIKDNTHDDDVVHLMSDTEIELHHHSDKEDNEPPPNEKVVEKVKEKSPETLSAIKSDDDDDVVEINNSSDDEMMNELNKSAEDESAKQTWEERWLSSSKTQKVLKTTQLARKVRGNIKIKKSQKASAKKNEDNEKAMKEKASNLEEEGSIEQFKTIKDNSN